MGGQREFPFNSIDDNVKFWVEVREVKSRTSSVEAIVENVKGPEDVFTTVIGQRLQHIACSNVPITSVHWNIEGIQFTATNYTTSTQLGQRSDLSQTDLKNNSITFCWWRGGTFRVTCSINTPYGTGQVEHSFNVTSPLVRDFNSKTGVVGVGDNGGSLMIRLAWSMEHFDRDGIFMNGIVAGMQSVDGTIAGIQLASNQRFCTHRDGNTPYRLDTNGVLILDVGVTGTVLYQNHAVAIKNDQQNVNYEVNDGPGSSLTNILSAKFIGDGDNPPTTPEEYQMYLMFYPHVPGAIWVPLKVLRWGWEGYTEFVEGAWSGVQSPGVLAPVASDPQDFPQWTENTNQSQWVRY